LAESDVGLVWLSGPVAGILGQLIIGVISDKVWIWNGRRRPFIIIGGTIAALMILALPNLDVINETIGIGGIVGVATAVALTLDLAINVSFNPARSIIADVTPEGEARTKGYTWMQTVSGFFGVLAYVIGAYIDNYFLIYFGAIFVFVCSVFPTLFIKEPRDLEAPLPMETATSAATKETDWGEFLKICFAHSFTWIGVQSMFIYIFFCFNIGVAFAILNTVGFLLPALVLQPLADKIGRVKTHTIAIAIMAIGYGLIVLFGQTITSLFILMAIVGIGWSAVVSLPFAIMSEVVNQKKMGLMMGLFNLSVVLPQIVASLLGGVIEGAANRSIIFMISAATLAISALLWLLVKEQKR